MVAASTVRITSVAEYPNWFEQTAQYNFEAFLTPLAGKDDLNFLQLGVFTGDASLWLAQNILTGSDCLLIDVDTWEGSEEEAHEIMNFADVYSVYLDKVKPYPFIKHWELDTNLFFRSFATQDYDFIYIDADHTTVGVLLDAEHSWPQLKSGGILAFDDYIWSHESGDPRLAPQVGIDLFLHRHKSDYELLARNNQVWLKKR
jgi:predicted O-methyltransferase YrrM